MRNLFTVKKKKLLVLYRGFNIYAIERLGLTTTGFTFRLVI